MACSLARAGADLCEGDPEAVGAPVHGGARADTALALARKHRQILQRVLAGVELDGAPVPPPLYPGPLLHICIVTQVIAVLRTGCLENGLMLPMQACLLQRSTEVQEG